MAKANEVSCLKGFANMVFIENKCPMSGANQCKNCKDVKWLGWWWLTFMFIFIGLGFWLQHFPFNDSITTNLEKLSSKVIKEKWGVFFSIYFFAIGFGQIIIHGLTILMNNSFGLGHYFKADLSGPAFIGCFEAILYPTSLITAKPEIIGVWLVLKVAGGWIKWQTPNHGRRRFNKFILGNALSLTIGGLTYCALKMFALK